MGCGSRTYYQRFDAIYPYIAAALNAPPQGPDLNQHGLTGSWYEPATSGQGFEVEVFPDQSAPGTGFVFVSWFTYDTVVGAAERQRWYTLERPGVTGQPSAALTIHQNTGGNFNGYVDHGRSRSEPRR